MESETQSTTATLATELTVKRSHFAFLYTALRHAGWEVDQEYEGITTDEGYDHEVRMRVRISVPLEALAQAPEVTVSEEDDLERLIADMSLLA